jgi:hypothetical protein
MWRSAKETLPLAFALAMAVEGSSDAALPSVQGPLRAGVFGALVVPAVTPDGMLGAHNNGKAPTVREQVVQYFPNFRNCFTGYWRSC